MVLTETKVIDGRGHLLGRLCSIVARELLAGQNIVLVRCNEICVSGSCKFSLSSVYCRWIEAENRSLIVFLPLFCF
jgi:ribosomal protein L13